MPKIDPFNKFTVSMAGNGQVVFLIPVPRVISQDDALLLAAWLVAITGKPEEFQAVLQTVLKT